jgi:hypothetical protein
MDIVGPLPKTKRENKYVLVIGDYATRYRDSKDLTIAEELMGVFTRFEIPSEILTDQGTNFLQSYWKSYMVSLRYMQAEPLRTILKLTG